MALAFFLKFFLAPIIIIVGLLGNTMSLIVISKKSLKKIGPILIYKFLFISDTIYLSKLLKIKNMFFFELF
jgi:hypothetical protein